MNTLTHAEAQVFIERCLAASALGFVFNLLYGQDHCDTFSYWQPDEIRALAESLRVNCEIATGYLRQDFSAALRHPPPAG